MRKKIAGAAFIAAAMMAAAAPSWAITLGPSVASSATVTVGGTLVANFTLHLRDVANPFGTDANSISWPAATAGQTSWSVANQLMVLNSTVTDSGGGIMIYTDNRNASASPKYVGPFGTPPAGLVSSSGNQALAMGWSIKAATQSVVNSIITTADAAGQITPDDPNSKNPTSFQWFFFQDLDTGDPTRTNPGTLDLTNPGNIHLDQNNPADTNLTYATMVNVTGIQFAQGGSFASTLDGSNTFVYLESNFTGAAAQATYGTNKIIVQAFTS